MRARPLLIVLVAVPLLAALAAAATMAIQLQRTGIAVAMQQAVRDATGLELRMDADPRLRLWPRPGLELGPLALTRGAGPDAAALAEAESLRIGAAALPLLAGRLELREVSLDGLRASAAWPWGGPVGVREGHIRLRYPGDGPNGGRGIAWSLKQPQAGPLAEAATGQLEAALRLQGAEPALAGELRLTGTLTTFAESGLIQLTGLELRGEDLSVGQGRGLSLALDAEAVQRIDTGRWSIAPLRLRSGTLGLTGAVDLAVRGAEPVVTGDLQVPPVDLRAWMRAHGYDLRRGTPGTLRCAAAEATFEYRSGRLQLHSAQLRADRSRGSARAWIELRPVPRLRLAARVDRLDLDPYLAEAHAAAPLTDGASDCVPLTTPAPVPPALPELGEHVQAVADVRADELRVGGLRYGRPAVTVRAEDGIVDADARAPDFYGGKLRARLERDMRPQPPRQTLRATASGVDAGPLLADLLGRPPITGTADVRAELTAGGADPDAMRADLSGTVELKVRDGRFAGLDLGPLLEAVGADPDAAESATAFSVLSATATGSGGRFQSDDIAARSPLLRVDGGGGVDVVAETLALDLTATFVEPPPGQGSRLLAGIRVPFGVSGPWRQPAWRVDLGGALREGARRALDRHSDQLKDLEDRLGVPGLEQGLRSLFGL